jgi:hypothetical protein
MEKTEMIADSVVAQVSEAAMAVHGVSLDAVPPPKNQPAAQPGRFDYVRYDVVSLAKQEALKAKFTELEQLIQSTLVDGRAKALVFTALEESYMWTGKSIRDAQIKRGGDANHQPARGE